MSWNWRDGVAAVLLGCGIAMVVTAAGGCAVEEVDVEEVDVSQPTADHLVMPDDAIAEVSELMGLDEAAARSVIDSFGSAVATRDVLDLLDGTLTPEELPRFAQTPGTANGWDPINNEPTCTVATTRGGACSNTTNPSYCRSCSFGEQCLPAPGSSGAVVGLCAPCSSTSTIWPSIPGRAAGGVTWCENNLPVRDDWHVPCDATAGAISFCNKCNCPHLPDPNGPLLPPSRGPRVCSNYDPRGQTPDPETGLGANTPPPEEEL